MKIIMVGMVAFVVCKYPSPEKNTKLEVKTNITTVKDSREQASNPNKRSGRGSKY
jgi:hypothetical protein